MTQHLCHERRHEPHGEFGAVKTVTDLGQVTLILHPPPMQTHIIYSFIIDVCFHFKGLLGFILHTILFHRYYAWSLIAAFAVPIKINPTK